MIVAFKIKSPLRWLKWLAVGLSGLWIFSLALPLPAIAPFLLLFSTAGILSILTIESHFAAAPENVRGPALGLTGMFKLLATTAAIVLVGLLFQNLDLFWVTIGLNSFLTLLAVLFFFNKHTGKEPKTKTKGPDPAADTAAPFWDQKFTGRPIGSVGASGLFPVRDASQSQIALLSNGNDALAARLQTLRNAKRSIRIQALIFTNDEAGRAIAQILKEKKKQGLDVRVIVDAFSNILDGKGKLNLETQMMYYDLKQNGIEIEGYEAMLLQWMNEVSILDPKQPDKRFHDKMWIIDAEDPQARAAIVGGLNIANEYFRTGATPAYRWRDQDFLVKGEIVADITATFDRNYADQKDIKNQRPGIFNTDKVWQWWREHIIKQFGKLDLDFKSDPLAQAKVQEISNMASAWKFETLPAKTRFIQSRPRYQETYIEQAYEALINSAEKELFVVNAYFIPTKRIRKALKNAARRGVKVTILTNSAETNDLPQMAHVSRYLYKELLDVNKERQVKRRGGNLAIAEWNGHKYYELTIHAKFAVADRKLVIGGSFNLDPRSANLNSETVVVFENERLASELTDHVVSKDMAKSEIITARQAKLFHDPKHLPDMIKLMIWYGFKGEL